MVSSTFELTPVPPFRLDLTAWTLRRRPHNVVDRWNGTTYRRVLPLPGGPVEVSVTQTSPPETARLQVVVGGKPIGAEKKAAIVSALERLLGLRIDLTEFYESAARDPELGSLARRFQGMKPPRFPTVFEGLINAMACQQLTLTLGIHLLNRLAVAKGSAFGDGNEAIHAFPRPEDLAGLSPTDLRQFGFSLQKARAMIELARMVAEGNLDLERLASLPDGEVIKHLCELRGIGRWSAEYVLLRGLGRTHIFPGDDVGARNNLQRWLRLPEPLNYEEVRRINSRGFGCGGLVYFHLLLGRLAEAGYVSEDSLPANDTASCVGTSARQRRERRSKMKEQTVCRKT